MCDPDEDTKIEFEKKRIAWQERENKIRKFASRKCLTKDGTAIEIGLNIGTDDTAELEQIGKFDFIGLFRTEFLYMRKEHIPNEEEQFEAYKRILLASGDKPVTLRSLDIGGDKTLSYMPLPHEDNPFLGNRALRLCLSRPELFRPQLRAALRASVYGKLWLMLPMVGSMEDIRRAKAFIDNIKRELDAEGKAYSKDIKLGIMVEIPSIAVIADKAAEEVDFASIGTNDLCQYLTAADRVNPAVAAYYQNYHPALFRIIRNVVEEFSKRGKSVSVCGELGGDVLAAPVLVGFGMKKLSMSASAAPMIKRILSMYTADELKKIALSVIDMDSQEEILPFLKGKFGI